MVSTKAYEYHYTAYGQLAQFDNLLTGKSISYKYDDDNRLIGFIEYDTDDITDIFSYTAFYDDRSRTSNTCYALDYAMGSSIATSKELTDLIESISSFSLFFCMAIFLFIRQ